MAAHAVRHIVIYSETKMIVWTQNWIPLFSIECLFIVAAVVVKFYFCTFFTFLSFFHSISLSHFIFSFVLFINSFHHWTYYYFRMKLRRWCVDTGITVYFYFFLSMHSMGLSTRPVTDRFNNISTQSIYFAYTPSACCHGWTLTLLPI